MSGTAPLHRRQDDRPGGRRVTGVVNRWPTIVALTLVNVAASLAAGATVLILSRPSQDQLQRAALEEVGLRSQLEGAPIVGPALDTDSPRIEARIVAETRLSAMDAFAIGVVGGRWRRGATKR